MEEALRGAEYIPVPQSGEVRSFFLAMNICLDEYISPLEYIYIYIARQKDCIRTLSLSSRSVISSLLVTNNPI